MSKISDFWNRLVHSPAVTPPSFQIPKERILDFALDATPFKANEAYFEIRIAEQFLKDKREYWNEYNPLTVVLTEFIYNKKRDSFPFVIGPSLLNGIGQLEGNERIRYKNTRVVGPTPYIGDDITLFLGLFRVKTKDWAKQALGLLETVAKVFDSTKLTSYVNISGPLTDGIESFFDMGDQMQFRLGQRNSFADPRTNTTNSFVPGYYVIIRADQTAINSSKFWIKDEQLYFGDNKDNIKVYSEHDYLLYKIVKSDTRNDYTTFNFHGLFEEAQNHIWQNNLPKAKETFQSVLLEVRRCADLIPRQITQLTTLYSTKFEEERKAYEASINPPEDTLEVTASDNIFANILSGDIDSNFDPKALDFIKISDEIFNKSFASRIKVNKPINLDNNLIKSSLLSDLYNKPELLSITPDVLSATASTITMITHDKG
jgi:hypothetical protein